MSASYKNSCNLQEVVLSARTRVRDARPAVPPPASTWAPVQGPLVKLPEDYGGGGILLVAPGAGALGLDCPRSGPDPAVGGASRQADAGPAYLRPRPARGPYLLQTPNPPLPPSCLALTCPSARPAPPRPFPLRPLPGVQYVAGVSRPGTWCSLVPVSSTSGLITSRRAM